ncbi:MAG: hypothetical protein K1X89_21055, partial [Myxococcaceae bacterium]|nr:hypothetical protein [Myxococcaceae bacterium]
MAELPLKRWSQGDGGDEARAAVLVRALREAPTLSPGALAAARQQADDVRAARPRWSPSARRWAAVAVAVPVLAAAAAGAVRVVEARRAREAPERSAVLPARDATPRPPPELPVV